MNLILVATNEGVLRQSLSSLLTPQYLFLHARSVGEMLAELQSTPVDLVIIDERFDNRQVDELLPRIFEIKASTVVLACVPDPQSELGRKSLALGAYDTLTKPLDIVVAKDTVARSLQHAYSLRERSLLKDRLAEMEADLRAVAATRNSEVLLRTKTTNSFESLRKLFEASANVCDSRRLFEAIIEAITDVFSVSRAALVLVEKDGLKLSVKAHAGLDTEILEQADRLAEIDVTRGIYRWFMGKDRMMVTDELSGEEFIQIEREAKILSAKLCLPLMLRNRAKPLGFLSIGDKFTGEPYSEAEREFLFALARYLTALIENALLFEQVKEQAIVDPLTQLFNRNFWAPRLKTETERSKRYGRPLSLAIFDLDHFKEINDGEGHLVGDEILRKVADLIRNSSRSTDVVGKYGGEEFIVILPETAHDVAHAYCERVRLGVEQLGKNGGRKLTISGGKAALDPDNDTPESLIKHADEALYEAKRRGRNQIRNYQPPAA